MLCSVASDSEAYIHYVKADLVCSKKHVMLVIFVI